MAESSAPPDISTTPAQPEVIPVDCALSLRQCWLVKVPKYLATAWENSTEEEVGKCQISILPGPARKHKIKLVLSKPVGEADGGSTEFDINLQPPEPMKMAVMVQNLDNPGLVMHGHINRRADIRPSGAGGDAYMKMKREQIARATKPARKTEMTELKVSYKPLSDPVKRRTAEEKEDARANKKLREDKDVVTERLFKAFEKHQFINIKDLVDLTNQPVTFVKELLKEFCDRVDRNPHRGMYELKPPYRHYSA